MVFLTALAIQIVNLLPDIDSVAKRVDVTAVEEPVYVLWIWNLKSFGGCALLDSRASGLC